MRPRPRIRCGGTARAYLYALMMMQSGRTPRDSGPTPRDEELRILILEDVVADAELLERALRTAGLRFVARRVAGRESFLRALEEFAPQLVLSDYEMPRYSGLGAIADVQERSPSTPVIIVTGAVDDDTGVSCIKAGAMDYVLKDQLVRLPSAIESVLEKEREHRRRVDAEERLRILSQTVEQNPTSVVITDAEGCIQYVNPMFTEVSGYEAEDVIGRNPRVLQSGHTAPDVYRTLWKTILSGSVWRGDLCNKRKDGALIWEDVTISPILDPDGTITHFVAAKQDITVRKEYEERLLRQATFDELTGLPNRLLALDRLAQALVAGRRARKPGAVAIVDLDRFQVVNDSLTHQAGDLVLKQMAQRLTACVEEGDTVARLDSDAFLLILQDLDGSAEVEAVAQEILDALGRPFTMEGQEFFLTASVGLSLFHAGTDDPHILLREADSAMHQVKEAGGNAFRFFAPQMNVQLRERLQIEGLLRHAVERGELSLHYQPIIALGSDRAIGAEALMRWDNPELGSVPPGDFIPIAEQTGFIVPIGKWALRTACREAADWNERGRPLHIWVNVSAVQFTDADLVQTVAEALEESGLPPRLLSLEITETIVMEDASLAIAVLKQLREIGVSLAMDDFGTGYSSLAYLRRLPVDTLKIDRLFVSDVMSDPSAAHLIAGIIGLAHGLGHQVVGEGVETREQLAYLRSQGCDLVQGHYLSAPLPALEFRAQFGREHAAGHMPAGPENQVAAVGS